MLEFWLCFVPLFVAVDALGTLPIFIGLTAGLARAAVRKVLVQSLVTATAVALAFLGVGKGIFALLGITTADFMIAGGALLFLLSLRDLLVGEREALSSDPESLGAVPLGVPLIAGPAVFTTSLLLVDEYGLVPHRAGAHRQYPHSWGDLWGVRISDALAGKFRDACPLEGR
jgi:multiple antibiotic resistance protein